MSNTKSPLRIITTDFRAGELDPRLRMRVDSKIYPSGASSLKNCLLSNTGAVSRRPGSTMLTSLPARRKLRSFEFDADEKYIFAFGDAALGIYDAAGTLIQSFSGSTDCPWNGAQSRRLTLASSGDVTIICHDAIRTKILTRTGLSTFTMANLSFDQAPNSAEIYQPYLKYELPSVTLAVSALSGTGITVTASSAIFSSAWVGDTIRIHGAELTITAYTSTTVVTATAKKTIEQRLDPNPFLVTDASTLIEVTHAFHGLTTGASITITGFDGSGGINKSEVNTTRTITVIDENRYTFVTSAGDTASDSMDAGGAAIKIQSLAATRNWDEQAFSVRRGWPGAVCFHEDRLWMAGTASLPDGLWGSRTGDYFNFDVAEGEDDASIQVSVGATRIARIRHILSNRVLQIFSDGAEFVAKQSDGVALTPSTVSIISQTPYGCTVDPPLSFDGATLFMQANDKTIREFLYDQGQDAFQSTELTTLSSHLVGPIADFAVLYGSATHTEQYAFFVNDDGTMAVLHSARAEQLAGWVPWETRTGDAFESICILGSKVFVSVLRGGTRWLERIEMDDPDITLDFSKSMTAGSPTVTWALGSDYASRVVKVTSNDYYLGEYTANGSGTITLDHSVSAITAGYDYDVEITPLPPDMQLPDGPMTGEKRRIAAVTAHFYETLSVSVNGRAMVIEQIGDDLSVAPDRINAKVKTYLFGYDRDPAVSFTQSAPLPLTILGLVMEVSG